MVSKKIIGGEFEINIERFQTSQRNSAVLPYTTYSSGRAALYNILLQIFIGVGNKCLLIPGYICDSVIQPIRANGWVFKVYSLTDDFAPDVQSLKRIYTGGETILIVNYFGLIDCERVIRTLHEIDDKMIIIQDNVQAPFVMFHSSTADFSFTSFRKAFPAPDGAWATTRHGELPTAIGESLFSKYKIAGVLLKGIGYHNNDFDKIYLELLSKGEELIDDNYTAGMSSFSKQIINALDWNRIQFIRRRNAAQIVSGLHLLDIKPMIPVTDSCVPLFIPISIPNRDAVRKALFENNIFTPVHWPVSDNCTYLERGKELARTELSLIVDQRYNFNDMQEILRVIERNI